MKNMLYDTRFTSVAFGATSLSANSSTIWPVAASMKVKRSLLSPTVTYLPLGEKARLIFAPLVVTTCVAFPCRMSQKRTV